jgi:hypothetical protein
MADAYYRSLYFSLNSPEDLELLGLLFALPRWRQPSAIKSVLRQYLPTVLDSPALGPDEVRTIVGTPARTRRRRRAHSQPNASSRPSTAPEQTPAREMPEPDPGISRAKDAPDSQTAERLLESRLDQLMKSRWIA